MNSKSIIYDLSLSKFCRFVINLQMYSEKFQLKAKAWVEVNLSQLTIGTRSHM